MNRFFFIGHRKKFSLSFLTTFFKEFQRRVFTGRNIVITTSINKPGFPQPIESIHQQITKQNRRGALNWQNML